MKKILIIGGGGFIGRYLVSKLIELNFDISILTKNRENIDGSFPQQVNIFEGSIIDFNLIKKIVAGKDWVINLATIADKKIVVGVGKKSLEVNCLGELNILEAIKQTNPNCKHLFMGSRAQFGKVRNANQQISEDFRKNPTSFYGIHKQTCEHYINYYSRIHNIHSVVLRSVGVYGPDGEKGGVIAKFIKNFLDSQVSVVYNEGEDVKDFIHIDDLVNLIVEIISKDLFGIYNVGSGKGHKFIDIVEMIKDACDGGQVIFKKLSPQEDFFELDSFVADISKITSACDWRPKIDIQEGIKRIKEDFEKGDIL